MEITNIKLCEVISIDDENKGDRIKVNMNPEDYGKSIEEIQYVYPLLPKMLHIKPKIGETVIVFLTKANDGYSNRYYIGPVISQMQDMEYAGHNSTSTSLFPGSLYKPKVAYNLYPDTKGSFADDNEIAIYGRKNSDIILGDNDISIRCGSRLLDNNSQSGMTFNRIDPAYIKMKYDEGESKATDKFTNKDTTYNSSINVVADKINLLSHNGPTSFNLTDNKNLIDNSELNKIMSEAHSLPYGDVLVRFLKIFLEMFRTHSHAFPGLPTILPQDNPNSKDFFNYDFKDMLSDNIKIN